MKRTESRPSSLSVLSVFYGFYQLKNFHIAQYTDLNLYCQFPQNNPRLRSHMFIGGLLFPTVSIVRLKDLWLYQRYYLVFGFECS